MLSSSGASPEGRPPENETRKQPFIRPVSAVTAKSVKKIMKPRGHSAPPRRRNNDTYYNSRPLTSLGTQCEPVLEYDSDDETDVIHIPTAPKVAFEDQTYVSKALKDFPLSYIATASETRSQRNDKTSSMHDYESSPSNSPTTRPSSSRPLLKRSLPNTRKSELTKAVNRERVLAQKAKKMMLKATRPSQAAFITPVLGVERLAAILESKKRVNRELYVDPIQYRLDQFRQTYPLRKYRPEDEKRLQMAI